MRMLSKKTQAAFNNYGMDACKAAWKLNRFDGEGCATIAFQGPVELKTSNQANAAINAWQDYKETMGK